jgi:hypothetical protein
MSMQQYSHIEDTYKRQLTCLSWTNRDVVAGYEDGTIKFFDPETGTEKSSTKTHTGIIWCFLFMQDSKKLFVGSNDSILSIWYNERVIDMINFNYPIFSLCLYQMDKLIIGLTNEVYIFKIESNIKLENEPVSNSKGKNSKNSKNKSNTTKSKTQNTNKKMGSLKDLQKEDSTLKQKQHHICIEQPLARLTKHHTAETKKIVSFGSKFFTADGAGKICVYDYAILNQNQPESRKNSLGNRSLTENSLTHTSSTLSSSASTTQPSSIGTQRTNNSSSSSSSNKMKISCVKSFTAHEAGITAMICVEDKVDNNTFLMTGSFDRTVKIWSSDGKCRHVVDLGMYSQDFCSTVTAISWNEKNKNRLDSL